jgi:hypothetical protein
MKKLLTIILVNLVLVDVTKVYAQPQKGLHVINTFHIASTGGWDYLALGPVKDWLYVSHGTQVNIINKKTGDSVGVIENTTGVHGIAFDPSNKQGLYQQWKIKYGDRI